MSESRCDRVLPRVRALAAAILLAFAQRMIGGSSAARKRCSRPGPVNRRLTDKAFAQVLLRG